MNVEQRNELLQQMLETEIGGVKVYETALTCVLNDDLKQEWKKYLRPDEAPRETVDTLMKTLGVASAETPGRLVVRHIGAVARCGHETRAKQAHLRKRRKSWLANASSTLKQRIMPTGSFSAPTGKPRKAMRRRRSTPRSEKPRTRKTSTFTTARAGAGSFRLRVWA